MSVSNHYLARQLLSDAQDYWQYLEQAYQKRLYNRVVRHGQEVLEYALKGLLKLAGVEFPKEHDIGTVFVRNLREKGIEVPEEVGRLIESASEWLAKARSPAAYWERVYGPTEAERARREAFIILWFGLDLAWKMKLNWG